MTEPIKIVFVLNGHDAVLRRWAVGYLSEALVRAGVDSRVIDLQKGEGEQCNEADAVLVYRSFDTRTMELMKRMRARSKFVMFFLDDYLFQAKCKYSPEWKAPIMDYMREADCLVSSSLVLLSKMPDKPKILRRSVLDHEATQVLSQEYRRSKEIFSIGWLAGKGRQGLMDGFAVEFLKEMDRRLEDEVCIFKCFGHYGLPEFKKMRVKSFPYHKHDDWKGLYARFADMDLGVVVNMLDENDDFCRCKSELKLVETGTMGVPMVMSRVEPFLTIVKEGETGFFASTPSEFADKVLSVMRDEALARRVSNNVKSLVKKDYDVDENAKQFLRDVTIEMDKWGERLERDRLDGIPRHKSILTSMAQQGGNVIGPVCPGSYIEQSMVVPQCVLRGIQVLGATYHKTIRSNALFEVKVNGRKVRDGHIGCSDMRDNQWWIFRFEPIQIREGSVLTVRIINKDPESNITFYQCFHSHIAKARRATRECPPVVMVLERMES